MTPSITRCVRRLVVALVLTVMAGCGSAAVGAGTPVTSESARSDSSTTQSSTTQSAPPQSGAPQSAPPESGSSQATVTESSLPSPSTALTEDEFWLLIDTLGGSVTEGGITNLISVLAQEPAGRITAFEDHLAAALYALDSPLGADVPIKGDEQMTMGDDGYLYVRCSVVAAGRVTWAAVRDDPASIPATWEAFDGEPLLYVAMQAYQQATGDEWTHVPLVSYETGSNTDNWA